MFYTEQISALYFNEPNIHDQRINILAKKSSEFDFLSLRFSTKKFKTVGYLVSEELNLRILNSRVMNVKTIRNQRMTSLQFWLLDTYVAWLGGVLPTEESDSPVSWPLWCQTPWWFTYYGIWPHALACLLRIHKTKLVCTPQSLTHRCPSCISQSLTSRCAGHDKKRNKYSMSPVWVRIMKRVIMEIENLRHPQ